MRSAQQWAELAVAWSNDHPPPRSAAAGNRTTSVAPDLAAWRQWTRDLHDAGFATMHWPRRWGGHEAGLEEVRAVARVLYAAGQPLPLSDVAVNIVAPAIMRFGSPAQQDRHLPAIADGSTIWTQLFSEPEAGSDLASLRLRAVRLDDGSWRISGQKVWNTYAHVADWGLLLARTGSTDERHRGLTMFLVPMNLDGIRVVPITELTGEADFSEVFFDDVVLPPDSVLGEVGGGWAVSMGILADERRVVGGLAIGLEAECHRLAKVLAQVDAHPDHVHRFAVLASAVEALVAMTGPGEGFPANFEPAGKILFSELSLELHSLALEVAAAYPDAVPDGWARRWSDNYIYARGYTISGGANEVLRNVLAQRGLNLPRSS